MGFYSIFRFVITLSSLGQTVLLIDQLFIGLFWFAEMFILFNSVGYFWNIIDSTTTYKPRSIQPGFEQSQPAVVILITAHDEPIELLRKTIIACRYISYENKRIVLVNSSETPAGQTGGLEVAQEQHVDHFFVPYPRHGAKAGSINEILKTIRAEYIVVFDADYRASRDFLNLLVPQMEQNDKLAFIQTPQFYGNITSSITSKAAQIQQSIFYEYICEGKSTHGGTFMCGTNLIIRTKALREIGGFDENSITEDFSTSLEFVRHGWESRFDNLTTAFGDGPQNIEQFFRQQYRWARGTLGVFQKKLPLILSPWSPLTLPQRFEYFLAGTYYFIGIAWLILILVPISYVFFRIPVYLVDPIFYGVAYLPYFFITMIFFLMTLSKRRYKVFDWFTSESLTILTVPVYAKAVIDTLFHKKAFFMKTEKDTLIDTIPLKLLIPQITLITLSLVGGLYGSYGLVKNPSDISLAINVFWCFFHVILMSFLFLSYGYAKFRPNKTRNS